MPKKFDYMQQMMAAKSNTPSTDAVSAPSGVQGVPAEQVEAGVHPTAPQSPFGKGLEQHTVGSPQSVPSVSRQPSVQTGQQTVRTVPQVDAVPPAKQLEFGGSSGSSAAEPVEAPPEDNPARQAPQKLVPKEPAVVGPQRGFGMDGYFDDGDSGELKPGYAGVEPGNPEENMPDRSRDPERLARIEEEQYKAQVRSELEAEYAAKGTKSKTGGKQPSQAKVFQRKGVTKDDVDMARLRNIPKCLVDVARNAFPDATRQEDAVAAYIYFREGMPSSMTVPDEIAELAAGYSGENVTLGTVRDIVERDVLDLKVQNRELARKIDALELAVSWSIFETAGFRKSEMASPEAMDFLEHGIADLMKRLEAQSELKRQRDRQRDGRPIR